MVGSIVCWHCTSRVQERGKDAVVLVHVKVIGLCVLHTQYTLMQSCTHGHRVLFITPSV